MNLITKLSKKASSRISSKTVQARVKEIQEFRNKSRALRERKQASLRAIYEAYDTAEFGRYTPMDRSKVNACKEFFAEELLKLQKQYGIVR